jgi:hypothetical protein
VGTTTLSFHGGDAGSNPAGDAIFVRLRRLFAGFERARSADEQEEERDARERGAEYLKVQTRTAYPPKSGPGVNLRGKA